MARRPDGRAVGYVQATVEGDTAWIAYVVGREHQRHGHAAHAVEAMLAHLARAFRVATFLAVVEHDNAPSIGLLRKLGFAAVPAAGRPAQLTPTERLYRLEAPGAAR